MSLVSTLGSSLVKRRFDDYQNPEVENNTSDAMGLDNESSDDPSIDTAEITQILKRRTGEKDVNRQNLFQYADDLEEEEGPSSGLRTRASSPSPLISPADFGTETQVDSGLEDAYKVIEELTGE